jgi:endonuclease III
MTKANRSLRKIIQQLEHHYGQPAAPITRDPFGLIVLEHSGYLVDDSRREAAFSALNGKIGLLPTNILCASQSSLVEVTRLGGIHAELRAQRIKESAGIVLTEFDGDLTNCLKLPLERVKKALQQFPSIGEPGAEKILLFTGTHPILALESNGLRVMLRLGFGEEKKNYSASYRSVRQALMEQTGQDCEFLIGAYQLLRRHGRETCKTNHPRCEGCPVSRHCDYHKSIRS